MRVRVLGWVVPVVLPHGVRSQVASLSVLPSLESQVGHRAALVVIRDTHGALVGLVVDDLSSEVPLLLLLETLEDVVGADFHHGQLVIETVVSSASG